MTIMGVNNVITGDEILYTVSICRKGDDWFSFDKMGVST